MTTDTKSPHLRRRASGAAKDATASRQMPAGTAHAHARATAAPVLHRRSGGGDVRHRPAPSSLSSSTPPSSSTARRKDSASASTGRGAVRSNARATDAPRKQAPFWSKDVFVESLQANGQLFAASEGIELALVQVVDAQFSCTSPSTCTTTIQGVQFLGCA